MFSPQCKIHCTRPRACSYTMEWTMEPQKKKVYGASIFFFFFWINGKTVFFINEPQFSFCPIDISFHVIFSIFTYSKHDCMKQPLIYQLYIYFFFSYEKTTHISPTFNGKIIVYSRSTINTYSLLSHE